MRPRPTFAQACLALAVLCLLASLRAGAGQGAALPSLRELEALGATIGEIRVEAHNIFDLADPREDYALFKLANSLHVTTRPEVIRRLLLFKPGERLTVQVVDETERLLRARGALYDAQIRPVAFRDGVVDLEVVTRDTWSLDLSGRYSRSGGANTFAFGLQEFNFLGTGTQLGYSQVSDVDRQGSEFLLAYGQAFDGWTALSYQQVRYDDGDRHTASVVRPFYALDARWAAGASWDDWNRVDSIYNAGEDVAKYRHRSRIGEAFGGYSPGLVDGVTHRFSGGVTVRSDDYFPDAGEVAPVPFPVGHSARGPFVRYEFVEDRFLKLRNRDQIARPEFFQMGLNAQLQVTRSLTAWGASRTAWLHALTVSRGFALPWGHDLLASAKAQRQLASTGEPLSQAGVALRYYAPQSARAAFYAGLSGDRQGSGGAAPDQLLLGGDNGLRGYPLRYQSGERRALFTLEQRYYTDWYPLRLLRVGGAIFADYGRAWGGVNQNAENGGWLSDVGVGLRLAFDRAAFGNVLHADIAVPLNRTPDIKSVQFLVKTRLTF